MGKLSVTGMRVVKVSYPCPNCKEGDLEAGDIDLTESMKAGTGMFSNTCGMCGYGELLPAKFPIMQGVEGDDTDEQVAKTIEGAVWQNG